MKNFKYYKPTTMGNLWATIREISGTPVFLSGGTDLFPEMKLGKRSVDHVVDVKGISELEFASIKENGHIRIGANVTLSKLLEKDLFPSSMALLKDAVLSIGSLQIRNKATLIGNICRASPASDSVPPLICLRARVRIEDGNDHKYLDLGAFLEGPGQTRLKSGEMVTEVLVPKPSGTFGGSFVKAGRVANDLAMVNVAVLIELDSDGITCSDARIVLRAVGPTAIRIKSGEKMLVGKEIPDLPFEAVADLAMNSCRPISDLRATTEYRKRMVYILTKRAIGNSVKNLNVK